MPPYFGLCLFCSKGIQANDDVSTLKECGHVYHTECISNFHKDPFGSRCTNMHRDVFLSFLHERRFCCLHSDTQDAFKLHLNYENSILGDPDGSADSKASSKEQQKIKALEEKVAKLKNQVALEKDLAEREKRALDGEAIQLRLQKEHALKGFLKSLLPKERHGEIPQIMRQSEAEVIDVAKLVKDYDEAKKKTDTLEQMTMKAVLDYKAARDEMQD